jgi:hypothetical protein
MGKVEFTSPVIDSVPKVNSEVAVGEDLEFQRKWWALERLIWAFYAIILLLALLGAFGRGWLAHSKRTSSDSLFMLKYDRIQRTGTPSDLTLVFSPAAVRNGQIRLFVSESAISKLGARRISPQPQASTLGDGGITYSFPVHGRPGNVVIALQPPGPGSFPLHVTLPDAGSSVTSNIVVLP